MAKKLTSKKARQILHDKEVHGQPLTDKQRRFFGAIAGGAKPYKAESGGWLDKYDAPKAQNGIEGTMGGLTDKGFNYNGAWGGQFEDGGNLQPAMAGAVQTVPMYAVGGSVPGSVGFTYARTQGIPSEGPYAKKTLPSAQGGKSIQEKRYRDLYIPLIDKVVNSGGKDWEKLPLSNTSFLENVMSGSVDGRNLPPMDPVIKEVQNKILAMPDSEVNNLLKVKWRGLSAPEAFLHKPKSVGTLDMLKYINHFKKLKKQGYTLQNGGSMKYYQEGLDFKPKTISKDGSEIPVDPMGYWNPENVGGPVIIPSNVITMEGVYEPLIGISDTGDVQYMKPGEDYEFDGESVLEVPVMQKGGRAPIYVDNPRDPRLRAYNDSLALYNLGENTYQQYKKITKRGKTTSKEAEDYKNYYQTVRKNTGEGFVEPNERLFKLNKKMPKGEFFSSDGIKDEKGNLQYFSGEKFKKPVQPVVYRKPAPPAPKKPDISIQPVEQRPVVPQPQAPAYKMKGDVPVYGPANSLIGMLDSRGGEFYPDYENTAGRARVNQADSDMLQNMQVLQEYLKSKGVTNSKVLPKQRNGGVNNADAQPIKKLDQLLNFTNYNKPTKGGWLDKYN